MKLEKLEQYITGLTGAESSYPFGPEALVYKIMGKMFALVAQNDEVPRVTLKCVPADAEILVSTYTSVIPGYYMNKKHWITISLSGELSDELLCDLVDESYALVASGLTKANRKQLEQLSKSV